LLDSEDLVGIGSARVWLFRQAIRGESAFGVHCDVGQPRNAGVGFIAKEGDRVDG
jgi:hypothetical protein